jgi:hypothetical protein
MNHLIFTKKLMIINALQLAIKWNGTKAQRLNGAMAQR